MTASPIQRRDQASVPMLLLAASGVLIADRRAVSRQDHRRDRNAGGHPGCEHSRDPSAQ